MEKCYLFCGNDFNAINKRIKEISLDLFNKSDMEVVHKKYEFNKLDDILILKDNLSSTPLFNNSVLSTFYLNPKLLKLDEKWIEDFIKLFKITPLNSYFVIVIYFDRYNRTVKDSLYDSLFFKSLVKRSHFEEFVKLYPWQLNAIREGILKLAIEHDLTFEEDALDLFVECFKDNLENINVELQKLQVYLIPLKVISKAVVEKLYLSNLSIDEVFSYLLKNQFLKDNCFGNIFQKFKTHKLPLYLIAALQNKFREAMQIKVLSEKRKNAYQISKLTGLSSYKIQKDLQTLQLIQVEFISKIVLMLSQVEYKIKTGIIKQENALDMILINI